MRTEKSKHLISVLKNKKLNNSSVYSPKYTKRFRTNWDLQITDINKDKMNKINSNFTIQSNDSKNIKSKSKYNPMFGVNKDLVKCDKLIFGPVFEEKKINFSKY